MKMTKTMAIFLVLILGTFSQRSSYAFDEQRFAVFNSFKKEEMKKKTLEEINLLEKKLDESREKRAQKSLWTRLNSKNLKAQELRREQKDKLKLAKLRIKFLEQQTKKGLPRQDKIDIAENSFRDIDLYQKPIQQRKQYYSGLKGNYRLIRDRLGKGEEAFDVTAGPLTKGKCEEITNSAYRVVTGLKKIVGKLTSNQSKFPNNVLLKKFSECAVVVKNKINGNKLPLSIPLYKKDKDLDKNIKSLEEENIACERILENQGPEKSLYFLNYLFERILNSNDPHVKVQVLKLLRNVSQKESTLEMWKRENIGIYNKVILPLLDISITYGNHFNEGKEKDYRIREISQLFYNKQLQNLYSKDDLTGKRRDETAKRILGLSFKAMVSEVPRITAFKSIQSELSSNPIIQKMNHKMKLEEQRKRSLPPTPIKKKASSLPAIPRPVIPLPAIPVSAPVPNLGIIVPYGLKKGELVSMSKMVEENEKRDDNFVDTSEIENPHDRIHSLIDLQLLNIESEEDKFIQFKGESAKDEIGKIKLQLEALDGIVDNFKTEDELTVITEMFEELVSQYDAKTKIWKKEMSEGKLPIIKDEIEALDSALYSEVKNLDLKDENDRKKFFRKVSIKFHPDRNGGNEQKSDYYKRLTELLAELK